MRSNEAKLRALGEVDVDALLASSSLHEWDELFTVKIFNISIGAYSARLPGPTSLVTITILRRIRALLAHNVAATPFSSQVLFVVSLLTETWSTEDLYRNESSALQLPHIRTPLLIVNALDDPLFPESIFPPAEVFRANPQLIFACTRYGGHTAWAEGCTPWPNDFTYMDRVAIDWVLAHLRVPRQAPELNV